MKRCQSAPRIFATVCPNCNTLRAAEQIWMKFDIGVLCRSLSEASHFPWNRTALADTSRARPAFSQNTYQRGKRLRKKNLQGELQYPVYRFTDNYKNANEGLQAFCRLTSVNSCCKILTPNIQPRATRSGHTANQFPDDDKIDSHQNVLHSPLNCPTPVLAPAGFTEYWSKALTAVRIVSSTETSVKHLAATARQHERPVISTRYDVNLVKVFSSYNIRIICCSKPLHYARTGLSGVAREYKAARQTACLFTCCGCGGWGQECILWGRQNVICLLLLPLKEGHVTVNTTTVSTVSYIQYQWSTNYMEVIVV
jgi:hypothetical protein